MKKLTVFIAVVLTLFMSLGSSAGFAASEPTLAAAIDGAAAHILGAGAPPEIGSVGGEWGVIGLARAGANVPEAYYEAYYEAVETYVKEHGGVLHEKKYTEYARVILGLTAAGYDPRDIAGYDLTAPLGDFEATVAQGINGPIWALIALDSRDYPIPQSPEVKTRATREMYLAEILRRRLPDGGWNLTANANTNEKADPDVTAMVLQALAKYRDRAEVKAVIDGALDCLSALRDERGGYTGRGGDVNLESAAQALVALCELGIPLRDALVAPDGRTLTDYIISFQTTDGGFRHSAADAGDARMSSEQALYALAAAKRAEDGKNSLYRMSDAPIRRAPARSGAGLPGRHADVKPATVISPGKTFADMQNHASRTAAEALAARGVLNGRDDVSFDPDVTMTRAEFAAVVTRGLGLPPRTDGAFADVSPSAWYADAVGAARAYGIVNGVTATRFHPGGTITRQEAAVMVARAAKLCGMDTETDETRTRDALAGFGDYRAAADWAKAALAFCCEAGILDGSGADIRPAEAVGRAEIAEMLYRLLDKSKLL